MTASQAQIDRAVLRRMIFKDGKCVARGMAQFDRLVERGWLESASLNIQDVEYRLTTAGRAELA